VFGGEIYDEKLVNYNNSFLNNIVNNVSGLPIIKQKIHNQEIDIEKILEDEYQGFTGYGVWSETVELQIKFNDRVAPGWRQDINQKKYSFWMATLDEVTEVLNSVHWKWWKDSSNFGTIDWDNVRVEMIDIFHFILSMALQSNSQHVLYTTLVALEKEKQEGIDHQKKDIEFFNRFWSTVLMATQMKLLPFLLVKWVNFWYELGEDMNSLFKEYRLKIALNNLRQEYGYGTKNSYIKIWPSPDESGKRIEDNAAVKILTEDIKMINVNTLSEIENRIKKYYLKHVAI